MHGRAAEPGPHLVRIVESDQLDARSRTVEHANRLATLAAEWHRTYGGKRPELARALEFYDRWLPGTMRRITGITRQCMPQCVILRGPVLGR